MRVLIVHNRYLQKGGEDTVFAAERVLLERHDHAVRTLELNNEVIGGRAQQLRYAFKSVFNPVVYRRVRRVIRAFRPDVVHVHNLFFVASPAVYYAARAEGVPVVQTLHNYRLLCPSSYLFYDGEVYERSVDQLFPLDAVRRKVWNDSFGQTLGIANVTTAHKLLGTYRHLVARYIVFTEFSKQQFLRSSLKLRPEQLAIKPNFVEDPGSPTADRGERFLFVGRLSPEKGIKVLLEAAARTSASITVVGDGPLRPDVAAAAEALPNLTYLGLKPREEVMKLLRGSRGLIFPSLWYEGMPMVILEALAAGAPVITSSLGNPASMVADGESGLHFRPGDATDLADKIDALVGSEAQQRLSAGARRVYEARYSPEANYERLIEIYASVSNASAT